MPNPSNLNRVLATRGWKVPTSAWPCDVDNDGDKDLVVAEFGSTELRWLEYEDHKVLDRKRTLAPVAKAFGGLAADMDGDGHEEIFVLSAEESSLLMLRRERDGQWSSAEAICQGLPFPSLLDVRDVNEDGLTDLVCASHEKVLWFQNTAGQLNPKPLKLSNISTSWTNVAADDIAVWNLETSELVHSFCGFGEVSSIAFSPDTKHLATAVHGEKDVIRLWDPFTGELLSTLPPVTDSGHVSDLEFSEDGKLLMFSAGSNGYVWDLKRGKLRHRLVGHDNTVSPIVEAPDGIHVVTCSHDYTIRIWSLNDGKPQRLLVGHKQRPVAICFAPDGKTMATGGREGEVILWDLVTGQQLLRLTDFKCTDLQDIQFLDASTLSVVGRTRDEEGFFSKTATWKVAN